MLVLPFHIDSPSPEAHMYGPCQEPQSLSKSRRIVILLFHRVLLSSFCTDSDDGEHNVNKIANIY